MANCKAVFCKGEVDEWRDVFFDFAVNIDPKGALIGALGKNERFVKPDGAVIPHAGGYFFFPRGIGNLFVNVFDGKHFFGLRDDSSFGLAPSTSRGGHSKVAEGNRGAVIFGKVCPPPFEHPFLALVTSSEDSFTH